MFLWQVNLLLPIVFWIYSIYRLSRAWELWWPRTLTMRLAVLSCWTTTQGTSLGSISLCIFQTDFYTISTFQIHHQFLCLCKKNTSIPFTVDDISKSMKQVDIVDIDPPPLIRENSGFGFLLPRPEWCIYAVMSFTVDLTRIPGSDSISQPWFPMLEPLVLFCWVCCKDPPLHISQCAQTCA